MSVSLATLSPDLVYLVLILGAFSHAAALEDIPSDYHKISDLGVAYKIHTEKKTWAEAKTMCMDEGATLALIDTRLKVREIANLNILYKYLWIGVSRTGSGAKWKNTNNTIISRDLPWAPEKPAGPHNCLAVRGCNKGLTNEDCYGKLGFICEMLISGPTSN